MKFRLVFLITVVLVAGFIPLEVNAQCGDPVPTEPEPSGATSGAEILFWHTMTESEAVYFQTLIDSFTEQTNISVVVKRVDPSTAYDEFVQASIKGNGTPDVFRVQSQYVTKLADDNRLLALCTTYNATEWADFIPQLLSTGMYVDKKWGVPQTAEIYGLYYNVHQLSNNSINPKAFANLNEFKSAITTLGADYQNENYGFTFGSMVEGYLPFMWAKGGNFFDGEVITINNDGSISGLDFVKSLLAIPETPGSELQFNQQAAVVGLQYGNISMAIDSTESVSTYLAGPMFNKTAYAAAYGTTAPTWVGPSNLGIAAIPGDTSGMNGTLIGGYSFVANAKTNNSVAVKSFIKYMTSVDTEVLLSVKNHFYPSRYTAIGNAMTNALKNVKPLLNNTKSFPGVPYWTDLHKILNENLYSSFINGQSSKQALDNVSIHWEKVIKEFKPQYDDPNVLKRTIPGFEIPVIIISLVVLTKRLKKKR